MEYSRRLHLGFAAVIAGSLFGLACESEELLDPAQVAPTDPTALAEESLNVSRLAMGDAERAEFEHENGRIRCQEGMSPSELAIRWEKPTEASQAVLQAVVTNHGSAGVSAEPVLIAANPALGETRERRLETVHVAPGGETVISVSVADFPLQSLGEATSVSMGLRWKRRELQQEMVTPQALSEPLFVTHDDDSFRTAVLRDHDSELRWLSARAAAARSGELQPVRRLTRALDLADAKKFRVIEQPGVRAPEVGSPAAETENLDVREP